VIIKTAWAKPCDVCKDKASTGSAVIQGTYYPCICSGCKSKLQSGQTPSSGHARWMRTVDAEDHEVDTAQPWGANGKPNKTFIENYPELAKTHFTPEQLRDAYR
jgi:hypothetical protein